MKVQNSATGNTKSDLTESICVLNLIWVLEIPKVFTQDTNGSLVCTYMHVLWRWGSHLVSDNKQLSYNCFPRKMGKTITLQPSILVLRKNISDRSDRRACVSWGGHIFTMLYWIWQTAGRCLHANWCTSIEHVQMEQRPHALLLFTCGLVIQLN